MESGELQCVSMQPNLLRLPCELRERIFELYINATPQIGREWPIEPHLLFVSKQLRAECLPVFYRTCTLTIQSYVKCDSYGHTRLTIVKRYHDIIPEKLRHIVRFNFRYDLFQQYTGELVRIDFEVKLFKRTNSWSIYWFFDRKWLKNPNRLGDPADFEDVAQVLYRHLKDTVICLIKDPGICKLTAENLDRMAQVAPDSLPLQTSS